MGLRLAVVALVGVSGDVTGAFAKHASTLTQHGTNDHRMSFFLQQHKDFPGINDQSNPPPAKPSPPPPKARELVPILTTDTLVGFDKAEIVRPRPPVDEEQQLYEPEYLAPPRRSVPPPRAPEERGIDEPEYVPALQRTGRPPISPQIDYPLTEEVNEYVNTFRPISFLELNSVVSNKDASTTTHTQKSKAFGRGGETRESAFMERSEEKKQAKTLDVEPEYVVSHKNTEASPDGLDEPEYLPFASSHSRSPPITPAVDFGRLAEVKDYVKSKTALLELQPTAFLDVLSLSSPRKPSEDPADMFIAAVLTDNLQKDAANSPKGERYVAWSTTTKSSVRPSVQKPVIPEPAPENMAAEWKPVFQQLAERYERNFQRHFQDGPPAPLTHLAVTPMAQPGVDHTYEYNHVVNSAQPRSPVLMEVSSKAAPPAGGDAGAATAGVLGAPFISLNSFVDAYPSMIPSAIASGFPQQSVDWTPAGLTAWGRSGFDINPAFGPAAVGPMWVTPMIVPPGTLGGGQQPPPGANMGPMGPGMGMPPNIQMELASRGMSTAGPSTPTSSSGSSPSSSSSAANQQQMLAIYSLGVQAPPPPLRPDNLPPPPYISPLIVLEKSSSADTAAAQTTGTPST